MNRGKEVIVVMVLVGLGLAVFAWNARYRASRIVLDRFGPEACVAIRNGETVQLLTLGQDPSSGGEEGTLISGDSVTSQVDSVLQVANQTVLILKSEDITKALGLIHCRHHLLHQRGFQWNEKPPSMEPNWSIGMRFSHPEGSATWLLDFDQQRAFLVEKELDLNMAPIASALKQFLESAADSTEPPD